MQIFYSGMCVRHNFQNFKSRELIRKNGISGVVKFRKKTDILMNVLMHFVDDSSRQGTKCPFTSVSITSTY